MERRVLNRIGDTESTIICTRRARDGIIDIVSSTWAERVRALPALQVRWLLTFKGWPDGQGGGWDCIKAIESSIWCLEANVSKVSQKRANKRIEKQ
jgi:hypothetical protein